MPGKQISDCITESIRNSRKVILVISNNFVQSPWCRFETDLAHHVLMDQNRDGLILIKLEELNSDYLEKTATQLHFLLKTRIYLTWSKDQKEQNVFWKKLHSALGFNNKANNGTYNQIRNMYQNYCTNYKPDLKRRHSVVLAPTTNELNTSSSTTKEITNNEWVNNLMNSLLMNKDQVQMNDNHVFDQQKIVQKSSPSSDDTSIDMNKSIKVNNKDQVDSTSNLNNQKKINEDDRLKLRNFNHFLNSYGKIS